jgi:hypothetical protein
MVKRLKVGENIIRQQVRSLAKRFFGISLQNVAFGANLSPLIRAEIEHLGCAQDGMSALITD